MKIEIRGFCETQNRNTSILISRIPATTEEDKEPQYLYGTIDCPYINYGGNCDAKNCSIVKQNGIKRF